MKNNTKYLAAICLIGGLSVPSSVSAIVEFGASGGYVSMKQTAMATSASGAKTTQTNTFNGAIFGGYGHVTLGIPGVLTLGAGPEIAFSSPSSSDYLTGVTKEEQSIFRIGANVKLQAEMIPGFSPYVSFAIGKDSITWTEEGKSGANTLTYTYSTGGIYFNALVGFQLPIIPTFALFLQGGITGAPTSTLTLKTYAINGVSQNFVQTGTAETSYSGYLINGGARLSF